MNSLNWKKEKSKNLIAKYMSKEPVFENKKENNSTSSANDVKNAASSHKDNRLQSVAQKKQIEALASNTAESPIQKKSNTTGLPDNLKSGIENLSGISMDDVKVHYNSNKPAQLNAHAYAQGTEIHIASRQEKHLPHEAWHVVQQKQGRVKPTVQMKGKVSINDEKGLELEADIMGNKAKQHSFRSLSAQMKRNGNQNNIYQRVKFEDDDIHGFSSIEQTINSELVNQKIDPANTLFISVGRSPMVFAKYLQLRGAKVVYVPMSGMSAYGTRYAHLPHDHDQKLIEKGSDILSHYLHSYLGKTTAMIVVDFGVSGGSNLAAYEAVKHYLTSQGDHTPVKMATLVVPPGGPRLPDSPAIKHRDNVLGQRPPDFANEAVKRVLWMMHLEIDKPLSFLPKYSVNEHVKGSAPPAVETEKEEEMSQALNKAITQYAINMKKPGYHPAANTLSLDSSKTAWINIHRKTITDKLGVLGKNKFTQAIILILLIFIVLWWFSKWPFNKKEDQVAL